MTCSLGILVGSAIAQNTNQTSQTESSAGCPVAGYFSNWFTRVAATQAEQPHWAPPVFTTSPLLQEVFRYDIMRQQLRTGNTLTSYGGGKGLEFIPAERIQFVVGLPAWVTTDTSPRKEGWADQTFLMKYRVLSANEKEGNYVLTLFGGVTVPNGSDAYSTDHFIFSPTVAFGKGWGDFDIQSTVCVNIPDNGTKPKGLGTPLLVNTAFQYRIAKVFWPQVEANYTYWPNGKNADHSQLFITPGFALGKFPIWRRLGVMVAAGCQIAVTDEPLYHQNYILSARFPF